METDSRLLRPPQWYRDAVIYEVHVRAFADSNDDGIGDFPGLTSKLDYLSRLGVDTIWLLPFYPSPLRDDGYDIADYFDVHSSYGTLDDFREFLGAAHARNMRVITEVVINHTSDQHPWFQRARRAEVGTSERDFYVWSDSPDRFSEVRVIFQDTETSNWAWDPLAGAYYWHRFFSHQPDLNYDNPLVHEAVTEVLSFWLDMGVDGVRLDAVPYLFEREGTNGENLPETHEELKRLRAFVDANYQNRMLLAEANQWPEDSVAYFGDGDECHMAFHFPLMPRLYLALQRENRLPIIDILEQTPQIPDGAQWAIFLRNHDELTLEMVSEEERDLMWRTYAPDRRARLNLGIRRRLAPLLANDRRRIELLFSLLLSLPGTPVLYYGDEIGMGDNIFLADRDGVRTPMQWSNDRNAGFSRANPQSLYLPLIVDPQFHYETVNVEAQQANQNSLLWWVRDMVRRRKRHPVFGRGDIEFLSPKNDQVLAFLRTGSDETIVVVANLSRHAQFVELDLSSYVGRIPIEMLGRTDFPVITEQPYLLSLGPYGYYWFVLDGHPSADANENEAIVIDGPLEGMFADDSPILGILAKYLPRQPWFEGAAPRNNQVDIRDLIPLSDGEQDPTIWIAVVEITHVSSPSDVYLLPLAYRSMTADASADPDSTIAVVRRDGEEGVVYDGLAEPALRQRLLEMMSGSETILGRAGSLDCSIAESVALEFGDEILPSTVHGSDRGESYVTYGGGVELKLFRHMEPGTNPDLELRRFLTERTAFEAVADAYGAIEYRSGDTFTIGVLQQSFASSATAWSVFTEAFDQWLGATDGAAAPDPHIGRFSVAAASPELPAGEGLEAALGLVDRLADTTVDLHTALASPSEDPDLAPIAFTQHYRQSLYQSLRAGVRQNLRRIDRMSGHGSDGTAAAIGELIAAERDLLAMLDPIRRKPLEGQRIRLHGDYRLDEVFFLDGQFIVEDFSGDHVRPLSERRLRGSPLHDVAQMLRSFDYVALVSTSEASREDRARAMAWSEGIRVAFARRYVTAMGDSRLLPDDPDAVDDLLNAFMITRALAELRWELATNPSRAIVPMVGIRRMLGLAPLFTDQ